MQALEECFRKRRLVSFAGGQDTSVRASYGAAGGTIGTGAGVLAGLLFMVFVYVLNKKSIDWMRS